MDVKEYAIRLKEFIKDDDVYEPLDKALDSIIQGYLMGVGAHFSLGYVVGFLIGRGDLSNDEWEDIGELL